jgi:hypothetical protein
MAVFFFFFFFFFCGFFFFFFFLFFFFFFPLTTNRGCCRSHPLTGSRPRKRTATRAVPLVRRNASSKPYSPTMRELAARAAREVKGDGVLSPATDAVAAAEYAVDACEALVGAGRLSAARGVHRQIAGLVLRWRDPAGDHPPRNAKARVAVDVSVLATLRDSPARPAQHKPRSRHHSWVDHGDTAASEEGSDDASAETGRETVEDSSKEFASISKSTTAAERLGLRARAVAARCLAVHVAVHGVAARNSAAVPSGGALAVCGDIPAAPPGDPPSPEFIAATVRDHAVGAQASAGSAPLRAAVTLAPPLLALPTTAMLAGARVVRIAVIAGPVSQGMDGERAVLCTRVWPQIARDLAQHGLVLEIVDPLATSHGPDFDFAADGRDRSVAIDTAAAIRAIDSCAYAVILMASGVGAGPAVTAKIAPPPPLAPYADLRTSLSGGGVAKTKTDATPPATLLSLQAMHAAVNPGGHARAASFAYLCLGARARTPARAGSRVEGPQSDETFRSLCDSLDETVGLQRCENLNLFAEAVLSDLGTALGEDVRAAQDKQVSASR